MSDPNLTARERIYAVREAEKLEAKASSAGPVARWVLLKLAAAYRWVAKDHRDYEEGF